ncbi:MAG: threonine synthase [Patescibacteria group bacterium]
MQQFSCIACKKNYPLSEIRFVCECGGLLDLVQPLDELKKQDLKKIFDERLGARELPDSSGVWRYRELLFNAKIPPNPPFIKGGAKQSLAKQNQDSRAGGFIISRNEGNTRLYPVEKLSAELGIKLSFKHEGENPTASFKDRGMTVAVSAGAAAGCRNFICASTGNTSASLASYCSSAGLNGIVIIPEGKIAYGKLSQALAYGAKVLQVQGDFDVAMKLVQELGDKFDRENPAESVYVLNSLNPFRVEGQKTIILELLQQLNWQAPDWIVCPAGNLGNVSAFGKAIAEAHALGLIDKIPRLAAVQASGANPFFKYFESGWKKFEAVDNPETIATAIKIGNPISHPRARRAIEETSGVVLEASEDEIMDAKAAIDAVGIGCEPASACSLAGVRQLVKQGKIKQGDAVVGILTGHLLKDPDATINYHTGKIDAVEAAQANQPVQIEAKVEAVLAVVG